MAGIQNAVFEMRSHDDVEFGLDWNVSKDQGKDDIVSSVDYYFQIIREETKRE